MSRDRPTLAAWRRRARPPTVGRFGRHRGNSHGWTPSGERAPVPRGANSRAGFGGSDELWVSSKGGRLRRWLSRHLRRVRPLLWRRAAVWRRSALLRGRWLPKSRLGRLGVAALSVATFGAGLWGLTRSSVLDVDHIDVEGASQITPDVLRAASGIHIGEPLFGVDLAAAREALEALPMVDEARVTRSFPNRVEIRMAERQPVALVARPAGGVALLDDSGRVVADSPERPAGLPEVTGTGDVPAPGAWLSSAGPVLDVVAALPESLRPLVSQAALTGDSVTLQLLGGPGAPAGLRREVRIGRSEDLAAKGSALVALLERLGGRAVAYIDVRVPSAPVVGPIAPPAPPAQNVDDEEAG